MFSFFKKKPPLIIVRSKPEHTDNKPLAFPTKFARALGAIYSQENPQGNQEMKEEEHKEPEEGTDPEEDLALPPVSITQALTSGEPVWVWKNNPQMVMYKEQEDTVRLDCSQALELTRRELLHLVQALLQAVETIP